MTEAEIIIVGGGPAGASCAAELHRAGRDALILDKKSFPRTKLCAGWVTPRVWKMLGVKPQEYPHSIILFKKLHYIFGKKRLTVPTRQYSIRRYEFDHWLLQRSGARFIRHQVQNIRRHEDHFIIDDQFRCKILVGAGGTNCPVYRTFFARHKPRQPEKRIATMELEFPFAWRDSHCYLWFFDNELAGYSWYVPKGNGHLNIGIGGKFAILQKKKQTIQQHWRFFVNKLMQKQLIDSEPQAVKGYQYFLRQDDQVQMKDIYLIGDAAGLATIDMGEGIGPAIQSGLLAAEAILTGQPYSIARIPKFSFWDILFWWR
ncbi:NAD(P)/FAD-dependent oxidoreductase [Caldithrix abyssi]